MFHSGTARLAVSVWNLIVPLTFFGVFIIFRFLLFHYFVSCSNNGQQPSFSMEALQKKMGFDGFAIGAQTFEMHNC